MRADDPKVIETVLNRMDIDCATRSVLSMIGGRKKFAEQFSIECGIMATRTKTKFEEPDFSSEDGPEVRMEEDEEENK